MATPKFNLNGTYVLYGEGTDARMSISIFKGKSYVNVFQSNNKQLSFPLDKELKYHLCKTLDMVKKASPETRIPIVMTKFNPQIKKREPIVNIVVGKNEKQIMYLEFSCPNTQNFIFAFKASKNIAVGSTPMGDAESTQIAVDIFINYLKSQLPMAEFLSTYSDEDTKGFRPRNNGGGGSYQGGGNRDNKYNNAPRDVPEDRTFEKPVPLAGGDDEDDMY